MKFGGKDGGARHKSAKALAIQAEKAGLEITVIKLSEDSPRTGEFHVFEGSKETVVSSQVRGVICGELTGYSWVGARALSLGLVISLPAFLRTEPFAKSTAPRSTSPRITSMAPSQVEMNRSGASKTASTAEAAR